MTKNGIKISNYGAFILGMISIIAGFIMSISFLGFINFNPNDMITGITLLGLSVFIAVEIMLEGRFSFEKMSELTAISLGISIISFFTGIYIGTFGIENISDQLKGVVGFLFLINAGAACVELRN